jgi:methylamine utilization protein MauE
MTWTSLVSAFAAAAQVALGIVLAIAVVPKLGTPRAFVRTVEEYQVLPAPIAPAAAGLLIAAETLLAVSLLTGWLIQPALPLLAGFISLLSLAVGVNLLRRRGIPCGCFGNASERISLRSLVRLAMMLAVALFLLILEDLAGARVWTPSAVPISLAMVGQLAQTALLAGLLLVLSIWLLSLPEVLRLLLPRRS